MKEFTKNELRRLARIEKDNGNFPLANFLERMGKGEISIILKADGHPQLYGVPSDIHCLFIEQEALNGIDEADDEYIQTILTAFGKQLDENATWSDAVEAINSAIKEWANPIPVFLAPEDAVHVYQVSIIVPARDYKLLEKATKKKTLPDIPELCKRAYTQEVMLKNGKVAEVQFFPPYPPAEDLEPAKSAMWRIMTDNAHRIVATDTVGPVEVATSAGVFICQLEPDPGYE